MNEDERDLIEAVDQAAEQEGSQIGYTHGLLVFIVRGEQAEEVRPLVTALYKLGKKQAR